MPTSTDVLLVCPLHGTDPKAIEIDGTKFCERCLKDRLLADGVVGIMRMQAVDKTYGEPEVEGYSYTCPRCSKTWPVSGGTSCPKCGAGVEE